MKCPSCGALQEKPEPRCPQCKLTLQKLDIKFGIVPASSRYLSDRSEKLPREEVNKLRAALRLFQKKFPQSLFSILVTELPNNTSITEYAFWLANRSRFSTVETRFQENFNIVLVVDLTANAAALNVGYGLEPHIPEEDLRKVLDEFAEAFRQENDLAKALHVCIDSLTRHLRERAQTERRTRLEHSAT